MARGEPHAFARRNDVGKVDMQQVVNHRRSAARADDRRREVVGEERSVEALNAPCGRSSFCSESPARDGGFAVLELRRPIGYAGRSVENDDLQIAILIGAKNEFLNAAR